MSLFRWLGLSRPVTEAARAKAEIRVLEAAIADKRAEIVGAESRYRDTLQAAHANMGGRGRVARALVWMGPRRD
jgi:hypothetical protein